MTVVAIAHLALSLSPTMSEARGWCCRPEPDRRSPAGNAYVVPTRTSDQAMIADSFHSTPWPAYRLAQLLYFMAPAYAANMAPPFARFWPGWNRPIDRRRLGSHKTVVGAAFGVFASVAVAFAQSRLGWPGGITSYADWLALGLLLGVGAVSGDALKSLAKRRRGIPPGGRWIPADQLDFVVGALLLGGWRAAIGWADVATILVVSFLADIVVNQLAFRLRIRETAW